MKKVIAALLVIALVGGCIFAYQWFKPHPKVEDAKGIAIAANALAKEYAADEKAADAKYLNKAIEVGGVVGEMEKNQDGGLMVILQTDDAAAGVQCSMREKNVSTEKGKTVTMKGFCSGNGITGISLTDCVLVQ